MYVVYSNGITNINLFHLDSVEILKDKTSDEAVAEGKKIVRICTSYTDNDGGYVSTMDLFCDTREAAIAVLNTISEMVLNKQMDNSDSIDWRSLVTDVDVERHDEY